MKNNVIVIVQVILSIGCLILLIVTISILSSRPTKQQTKDIVVEATDSVFQQQLSTKVIVDTGLFFREFRKMKSSVEREMNNTKASINFYNKEVQRQRNTLSANDKKFLEKVFRSIDTLTKRIDSLQLLKNPDTDIEH